MLFRMRRAVVVAVILAAGGTMAFIAYLSNNRQPPRQQPIVDRHLELLKLIADQEVDSAHSVAKYQPKSTARFDDLNASVVDLFRSLPGVVNVEVGVQANQPACRIIHLRDWHLVAKELFVIDMTEAHGRVLSKEESDLLYEQHLLEVQLIQLEQLAVLRCLIKHHSLKQVFAEGFSPAELGNYREKIAVLRSMEKEQIPQIRKQLTDARKLLEVASEPSKEKARAIEGALVTMLDQHKHRLLEMGASGRLLIAGELEDVLPLEEAATLEHAKPITPAGKVTLDSQKIEARHDAQVRAAMKGGQVAFIVLGGAHDLTDAIRRCKDRCEYLRITTKRFQDIAAQETN